MKSILNISLSDIKSNWKKLNKASKGKASAVVKANAYGMGMLRVVEALIDCGCNYFYVANIDEGIELRKKFTSKKISIAIFEGFLNGNQQIYIKYNLTPIINSIDQFIRFKNLKSDKNNLKAILNIDTGMNRFGLTKEDTKYLFKNSEMLKNVKFDFIMSHLANAHNQNNINNIRQLNDLLDISRNFPNTKISFANSEGIKLGSKFCFDQTRPGIGIYGIDSYGKNIKFGSNLLKLPFKLNAPILQIREVEKGEKVSYGGIDTLKRNSKLATIGLGYADGWIRLLKSNNFFSVNKSKCKIVGNITMDSFVLDITDAKKSLQEGDYICLLENSNIEDILQCNNIISYELLTLMGNRIERKYL